MPSPHTEYSTNGQYKIHYREVNAAAVDMDNPSTDGTAEYTTNGLQYVRYNDTSIANPDGGGEQNASNQEYEAYDDANLHGEAGV